MDAEDVDQAVTRLHGGAVRRGQGETYRTDPDGNISFRLGTALVRLSPEDADLADARCWRVQMYGGYEYVVGRSASTADLNRPPRLSEIIASRKYGGGGGGSVTFRTRGNRFDFRRENIVSADEREKLNRLEAWIKRWRTDTHRRMREERRAAREAEKAQARAAWEAKLQDWRDRRALRKAGAGFATAKPRAVKVVKTLGGGRAGTGYTPTPEEIAAGAWAGAFNDPNGGGWAPVIKTPDNAEPFIPTFQRFRDSGEAEAEAHRLWLPYVDGPAYSRARKVWREKQC